jgi:hypothetical protein
LRLRDYDVSTLEEYVEGLDLLKKKVVPTYYSPGARERGDKLASMAERGYVFLKGFFRADVDLALLVLNSNDWSKRTSIPYGIPFTEMGAVHFAADIETPAIKTLSPMFDNCPQALKKSLISAAGYEESAFTRALQIWFDHLIVHEFTHAFCERRRVNFGASWLGELFANYTVYTFLKRFEAEYKKDLRVIEVVVKAIYEGGRPLVKYTSLEDFERLYARVGFLNFAWYHGKFFIGVFELYSKYGESFIANLIDSFKVTDDILAQRIDRSCKGFEQWLRTWRRQN